MGELSVVLIIIIGELGLELPLGDVRFPGLLPQGRVGVQLDLRAAQGVGEDSVMVMGKESVI